MLPASTAPGEPGHESSIRVHCASNPCGYGPYPCSVTTACFQPPHVAQAASDPGHPSCDLVSLDGGHTFAAAMGDIIHMRQLASKGFALFVMNNVYCEGAVGSDGGSDQEEVQRRQLQQQAELQDHCQGPTAALEAAVRHGLVEVVKVGATG